jgi:hypothetical protein
MSNSTSTSDPGGFRDRDLELGLFSAFAFFGVLGVVLIPPVSKLKIYCGWYAHLPGSMKTAVAIYVVYLINVWFVCSYAIMVIFFEIQLRLWDLHLYGSVFYGFCLCIGAVFMIFAITRFVPAWLIVFHVLVTNMIATMIYPCDTTICFVIRSTIVIGVISILTVLIACCTISGRIAELLTTEQTAIVGPFCAVFALANATMGLEYWIDEENPWYLLVIALAVTIFKQIAISIARRLACCTHWTELIDEEIVLLEGEE